MTFLCKLCGAKIKIEVIPTSLITAKEEGLYIEVNELRNLYTGELFLVTPCEICSTIEHKHE